jgi:lipoyl-dependent peroxiredoxin
MIRKAKAVWRGTGRAGSGNLSTDSGVLAETPYSFRTRFENEKGTNPEELIAAAHARYASVMLNTKRMSPI